MKPCEFLVRNSKIGCLQPSFCALLYPTFLTIENLTNMTNIHVPYNVSNPDIVDHTWGYSHRRPAASQAQPVHNLESTHFSSGNLKAVLLCLYALL